MWETESSPIIRENDLILKRINKVDHKSISLFEHNQQENA